MDHRLVTTGAEGPGIDGGITRRPPDGPARVNYVDVGSIEEYIEKVQAAGGRVLQPQIPIPASATSPSARTLKATPSASISTTRPPPTDIWRLPKAGAATYNCSEETCGRATTFDRTRGPVRPMLQKVAKCYISTRGPSAVQTVVPTCSHASHGKMASAIFSREMFWLRVNFSIPNDVWLTRQPVSERSPSQCPPVDTPTGRAYDYPCPPPDFMNLSPTGRGSR